MFVPLLTNKQFYFVAKHLVALTHGFSGAEIDPRGLELSRGVDCDLGPEHFKEGTTINSPHCQEFMV